MSLSLSSRQLDTHRSAMAGPRVAAIISVIESCRRLKIPVRNYLANLPGLANARFSESQKLLLQPGSQRMRCLTLTTKRILTTYSTSR